MTERDRRNQQSDWNDRNQRSRESSDDFQHDTRQPQQWRDDGFAQSGGSHTSGQHGNDQSWSDRGQLGGGSASYSGDRTRSWQGDDERSRRSNEAGGDDRSGQHRYGAGYGGRSFADRYDRQGGSSGEARHGRSAFSGTGADYSGQGYGPDHRARSYGGAGNDYRPDGYATAGRDYLDNASSGYGNWRAYGEQRGFFDKAGDEIASWFGDEDASRRREQDHRGRGPSGYTRSDDRIREDANDALTHDSRVDATDITVKVEKGEVTLEGTVGSREAKRRAEDTVDRVSGVRHVQNNLRVTDGRSSSGTASTGSGWSTGGSSSAETRAAPAGTSASSGQKTS